MLDYFAHFVVSPVNHSLLLIFFGMLCLKTKWVKRHVAKRIIYTAIVWLVLTSQYFFSHLLMQPLENNFPPVKVEDETWQGASAIWVLGCYHYDAQELPRVSQFNHCSLERLVHAANFYRKQAMPIYITGGIFNPFSEYSHASQSAMFLQELGVNPNDIKIFEQGENTKQEVEIITNQHQTGQLLIITSASHTQRVHRLVSGQYENILMVPVHFATRGENRYLPNFPSTIALRRSERALYEYAALLRDFIKS